MLAIYLLRRIKFELKNSYLRNIWTFQDTRQKHQPKPRENSKGHHQIGLES